ncbi:hypothetical protein T8K17_07815 [Thalassobaculum sp. OXR-137]|uniref:hypothetical protein n=1 Tax=Thalassobaculum sp. OXR-137 TaxID=3100173 RepID=UPI002AC9E373|nr:hypothetical protein [Thalassobaculum sp. OXR-137]WPZ36039.1 hypothetical protein T8K17_07815 [Thalassobaculum sp. OXR-137]
MFWFSGKVTRDEVIESQIASVSVVPQNGEFVTLTIFESDVEAPDATLAGLKDLYRRRSEQLKTIGSHRRAGATLLSDSSTARMLIPLWNALRDLNDTDITFAIFETLDDALAHLEVDPDYAREVMLKRRPVSAAA